MTNALNCCLTEVCRIYTVDNARIESYGDILHYKVGISGNDGDDDDDDDDDDRIESYAGRCIIWLAYRAI